MGVEQSWNRGVRHRRAVALLLPLFFSSGVAGLVYQVLWARQLQLVFGTSTFAISTVLSTFMAGLGLGGLLAARYADASRRPLRATSLKAQPRLILRPIDHLVELDGHIVSEALDLHFFERLKRKVLNRRCLCNSVAAAAILQGTAARAAVVFDWLAQDVSSPRLQSDPALPYWVNNHCSDFA